MENQNISFVVGNQKFNFRVAGFITNGNKVLLEKTFDFWSLPGGRVQMGEGSLEAMKREIKEEMQVSPKSCELIKVCENFFKWNGNNQQEMLFIYRINFDDASEIYKKESFTCADSPNEVFTWHDIEEVKNLKCLPEIIYDLVKDENQNIEHIINEDK